MKRILALTSAVVATIAMAACTRHEDPPTGGAARSAAVQSVPVTLASVAERLDAGGVVTAHETAAVSSRILAPILDVRVRAGDRVRRGDVLVTLDARDVADHARQAAAAALAAEKGLLQARSALAAAEADHRLAVAWHGRIIALHAKNSATAQERDEADARLAGAAARVDGARAAIAAAEAHITAARAAAGAATTTESFTVVRAPFDGLVTERLIDPGNLATPGTPLLQLESAGARRVEVTIDEARAGLIQPGDRVDVLLERRQEGEEALPLEGTVSEVARAIAVDRRAFIVKITVPHDPGVRTGTFARVLFRGATRRTLLVPANAVRRQGQVTSVFVVEDGVARLRLVQLGAAHPEGIVVLAGLDEGEVVIPSPPPSLLDGHAVRAADVTPEGARP